MGGEHDLILFGKLVKKVSRRLLELRMQVDLRDLHHDDTRDFSGFLHIGFQQRQNIDAPYALSLLFHSPGPLVFSAVDHGTDLKQRIHVVVHIIKYIAYSSIFVETFIDLFHKMVQIQVIQLVFK